MEAWQQALGECNLLACPSEAAKHVAGAPSFDHLRNLKGGQNDSSNDSRQSTGKAKAASEQKPLPG